MNLAVRPCAGFAAGICACWLVLSPALAETYSWQVSSGYRDEDAAVAVRSHHRTLRATYYLSPVDDAAGPYELAPFLNRSSYVSVGAGRTKLREQSYLSFGANPVLGNATLNVEPVDLFGFVANPAFSPFPSEFGFDTSDYALNGRYVWPGSGWYAGAHAQRGDNDAQRHLPYFRTTAQFTRNGVFAGRYFGTRTAVEVELGSEAMSEDVQAGPFVIPPIGLPAPTGEFVAPGFASFGFRIVTDDETDHAKVSVRHIGDLGDSTFEFSAGVYASRTDTQTPFTPGFGGPANPFDRPGGDSSGALATWSAAPRDWSDREREREVHLSGALFPVESLGVRLTVSTSDHDAYGTRDRLGLAASWFFVRSAAVEIELTSSRSAHGFLSDPDAVNSVGVRLFGRF